ncbi:MULTISPECIES: site-specific integrase [unclassified Thiomonas]|jgi:integrase|uniref:tyrosine-type recombinase/integrase n=1 Tax=unclassified Thiomonas TaxID=2625466 RepID=UPI00257D43CD|nr:MULTISPECIES: site-specific integrase [unclassified Thiomonas]
MPSASKTFDLKSDAESWARELEREAQRGNIAALRQDAQRVTVGEVMDRYLAGPVQAMKSAKDVRTRLSRARERFGAHYLSNVRGVDLSAWRDDLLQEGLAPQTVIHHINALSALFSFVEKDLSIDLPAGNPARKVRKPAAPKGRDRRLRPGELEALLQAATSTGRVVGLREVFILAVETSMRLGELLGLEWSRIDLAKCTAHLVDTKNGESRTVALSVAAMGALRALPRRIDGRVFGWAAADSFEKAWTRCKTRARRLYEADCAAQGIKPDPAFLADLRFHDLRHEAISRLFEKGLGIMKVSKMSGHKSLQMLGRYTHVDAQKLAPELG